MATQNIEQSPRLPSTGYIRMPMLLHFLPFSEATVWRKLKDPSDPLPRPYKLGPKISAFKVEEVREYLDIVGTR